MIGAVIVTTLELGFVAALFPFAVGVLLSLLIYTRRAWFASPASLKLR